MGGEWEVWSKHTAAGLHGVLALPDHRADGSAQHVCFSFVSIWASFGYTLGVEQDGGSHTLDQAGEEALGGEIGVCFGNHG